MIGKRTQGCEITRGGFDLLFGVAHSILGVLHLPMDNLPLLPGFRHLVFPFFQGAAIPTFGTAADTPERISTASRG